MISRLLGIKDLTYVGAYLRHPWPAVVVLLLVLAAAAYAAFLYRTERTVSRGLRLFMGAFRALLYAVLLVLLFEPVLGLESTTKVRRNILVLLDSSESMGIRDQRRTEPDLVDAALCLGKIPIDKARPELSPKVRAEVGAVSRLELAKAILDHPQLDTFKKLGQDHKVRYFCFGERLEPTTGEGEVLAESLKHISATAKATRLGTAIEEAVSRYSGQSIAAVLVLTDGASNEGLEPLEVARRMKERTIPLYTIGLGLPHPPDVRIQSLIVQDTVFYKDKVPVRVQIASNGFTNRTVELTAILDGQEVVRRPVTLTGKPQFEELSFIPDQKSGTFKLEVATAPLPGETLTGNNKLDQSVRVIDEKIKVLYVEGKPRWEYRYLRAVLLRDHRLDVKFLMTQGDRDLAKAAPERYLAAFPEVAAEAFRFDLVILGDVPANYFSPPQLARMHELVHDRGGSLLLLAGHQNPVATYLGTPIAAILPVKLQAAGWEAVDDSIHPIVTLAGKESTVTSLEANEDENKALWALVRPLYQVPALLGAKPAATVLLTLSDAPRRAEPYPLVAWHRYGTGRALYVGTDQLWRLRFKRGDKYHARFWGQAIQFLTLARLLGENKRVHVETGRREFRTGERVQIYANVLNESYEPIGAPAYTVYLERQRQTQPETTPLKLEPVKDVPGLYEGFFLPERDGQYRLRVAPADQEAANDVQFKVTTTPLEQLEPAMQEDLLRKMGELSGGKYLTIRDLPALPDAIEREQPTTILRREKELWDLPAIFVILLLCAGTEWFVRRKYDLI